MKKISVLVAALAMGAVSFGTAEGFKVSGYIRAGFSSAINSIDTDDDGDNDTSVASTDTWLAGDYFGGGTRSRLNVSWSNSDESAGAFVRWQYTGAAEDFDVTKDTKYAFGWVNPFEGKLTVAAGKIMDNYIGSDGWEGFSVLDGKSGVFAGVNPIAGLTIGGGAVVDYLDKVSESDSSKKVGKKLGYFGAKYTTDAFTVDASYALAGEFCANVNITAVENLFIGLEYNYDSDDIIEDGNSYASTENIFVEQVEYTGIDKLVAGVLSYQYVNCHEIGDDSNTSVTITPYARYELSDVIAASLEGTVYLYDYDNAPDTYATIVPAVYFKVADGAEANVFAQFSTDTDTESHKVGAGVKYNF